MKRNAKRKPATEAYFEAYFLALRRIRLIAIRSLQRV